jgi:16S rRNA (uracil1498-N3)-methyltransferase
MSFRRFWWDGEVDSNEIVLSGDLVHHIRDVVRFSEGDRFELLGQGKAWLVEILNLDRREIRVRKIEARPFSDLKPPYRHLFLSVPRFTKVDWIVEKSVELGVKGLHLFVSEFSHVRDPADIPPAKIARWQKLTQAAAQQSGRGDLMEIHPVTTLNGLLERFNRQAKVRGLFLYEGESARTLKQALSDPARKDWDEIWCFVGSEGGFSKAEVEAFAQAGLEPLNFGSQILRVETACVALCSVLKYEFESQ